MPNPDFILLFKLAELIWFRSRLYSKHNHSHSIVDGGFDEIS